MWVQDGPGGVGHRGEYAAARPGGTGAGTLPQAAVGPVAAAPGHYARQHRRLDISKGTLP